MGQGTRERETKGAEQQLQGYKKLRAWQSADELAVQIFGVVKQTPTIPSWLAQQMMRAAVSVPANLAEGYSRGGLKDYLRFLDIARGSLGELEYYVHLVERLHLLNDTLYPTLNSSVAETGRLLFGLIRSLSKKESAGDWDRTRGVKASDTSEKRAKAP